MNTLSLFNSLFDDMAACNASTPLVDVLEKKDAYELQMELPGLTEKDIALEIKDRVLSISSKKEDEQNSKEKAKAEFQWLVHERRTYDFDRRFTLPQDIDEDKVSAAFKNGILTVTIPRKALPQPKRIAIKVA